MRRACRSERKCVSSGVGGIELSWATHLIFVSPKCFRHAASTFVEALATCQPQ